MTKVFSFLPGSKKRPEEIYGWIAYLDIFGFRGHLESNFFSESEDKLLRMHEALAKESKFNAGYTYFMFSDSIVLWSKVQTSDDKALKVFIDRIAITQQIVAQFGFLLRGSVAYGRILLSSNYILGDAYLRAYTYEANNLIDPIIVIPEKELKTAEVQHLFQSELAWIKLKNGSNDRAVKLHFVPWDQIKRIKDANIAAIMSSSSPNKTELVARWERVEER